MAQLHHIYLKYVMGELEYDAIMLQARRYGLDSPKKFLNLIVTYQIDRFRAEYIATLTEEELADYGKRESETAYSSKSRDQSEGSDLDTEIPF